MDEERKAPLNDTPLSSFVNKGWLIWSQRIVALQVREDDFLLYLAWALDTIKDNSPGLTSKFRDVLYSTLRSRFIESSFTANRDDLEYLTNLICASSLECLGLALNDSQERLQLYSELVTGFGKHWKDIEELKYSIEKEAINSELKKWIVDYFNSERFYTFSDTIEWDNEDMGEVLIHRAKSFDKIDLYRVIIALYKANAFQSLDGSELKMNKVFQAFGDMLGEDYSNFQKNLSAASINKGDVEIFRRLEACLEEYEEEKDEKLLRQNKPKRR